MTGQLNLKKKTYLNDYGPIDKDCDCSTCQNYSRSYIHCIATHHSVACHLLTVHNLAFQFRLMKNIRDSIKEGRFPEFVRNFFLNLHPDKDYPKWVVEALDAVDIKLE